MERVLEPELMTDIDQARAYASSDFSIPHNAFVKHFARLFPEIGYALVADLGCGPADVTIRLARANPNAKFIGFDGSEAMLSLGRQAVQEARLSNRIHLVKRLLPDHNYPTGHFNAVVSNSLLHHLPDPQVLWRCVKELVYPNDPALIMDLFRPQSEKAAQDLVELHAQGAPKLMARDFYHSLLAAFSPEQVGLQLDEAGLSHFTVETVSDRHMLIHGRR